MLNAEPRVADEDDEDEVDEEAEDRQEPSEGAGTSGEASEKPVGRRCSVRFTDVTVLHHDQELDESKLPSAHNAIRFPPSRLLSRAPTSLHPPSPWRAGDGLAPIGLGALQRKEVRRLDSYELERSPKRQGVGIVPPEERRQAIGVKRAASVERVENDNAELKRAHVQSVREHIRELRAAQSGQSPQMTGVGGGTTTEAPWGAPASASGTPASGWTTDDRGAVTWSDSEAPAAAAPGATTPTSSGSPRKRSRSSSRSQSPRDRGAGTCTEPQT